MRIIAIIVALSVGASGCAVIGAKAPAGPVTLESRPSCNDGKGGVVADGLGAATFGIESLGAFAADEAGPGAILGLITVAYIASAVSGNSSANKCREARDEYDALLEDRANGEAVGLARPIPPPEDVEPPPIAPRPPVVAPKPPVVAPKPPVVASKPPPTLAMRPPAPPVADTDSDTDSDSDPDSDSDSDPDSDTDPDTDSDPGSGTGRWSQFWREVTP